MLQERVPDTVSGITDKDLLWLNDFGADITDDKNAWRLDPLNELIENDNRSQFLMSRCACDPTPVIHGREKFLTTAGVPSRTIEAIRFDNPTLVPLSTAVKALRALTEHNFNAQETLDTYPDVVRFGQSLAQKLNILKRTKRYLRLSCEEGDLISLFPTILSRSALRLEMLALIAAKYVSTESRTIEPGLIRSLIIRPLENYVLALYHGEVEGPVTLRELVSIAGHNTSDRQTRRGEALKAAQSPRLGKIGTAYIAFREEEAASRGKQNGAHIED